jgi:hypothetical protein
MIRGESVEQVYEKRNEAGKLEYEGVLFAQDEFPNFIKQTISPLYRDTEFNDQLIEKAIEMTGFESDNLREVFKVFPKVSTFRIGELIAEKIVESRYKAVFTYNSDRDLKNLQSNNTGADLVGFIEMEDGAFRFLFGEVKTSSDLSTPPNVMYGSDGMIDQLIALNTGNNKIAELVKWMFIKCSSVKDLQIQKCISESMQHFAKDTNDIRFVGVLVRDTSPSELDLKNRYKHLVKNTKNNENIQLMAVYSNYSMENGNWEKLI